MEFVRLFREIVMVLLFWTISVEPKYTKFMYEEQLLEKMVRLEMFVENMEKDIKKLISDSMIVVNEIRNSTKSELNKVVDRMDQFKSEMDSFHNNMTEWKDKTDFAFEAKMAKINVTLTKSLEDIEADNRVFKSDLTTKNEKEHQKTALWKNSYDEKVAEISANTNKALNGIEADNRLFNSEITEWKANVLLDTASWRGSAIL